MGLVTIRTFDNSIEANLMKAELESHNITCFLFDENITGMYQLYNAVGGIKLKISESDIDKATALIEEIEKSYLTDDQGEALKCPNCQSEELYSGFKSAKGVKGIKGILSAMTSFLFAVFPTNYDTVYKCKNCGNEFKENE